MLKRSAAKLPPTSMYIDMDTYFVCKTTPHRADKLRELDVIEYTLAPPVAMGAEQNPNRCLRRTQTPPPPSGLTPL